jgi:hypothetical protein
LERILGFSMSWAQEGWHEIVEFLLGIADEALALSKNVSHSLYS